MCTGHFVDRDQSKAGNDKRRPASGTKCVGRCIEKSGRWGSSFCFTEEDKSNWGAECVSCPGLSCQLNVKRMSKLYKYRFKKQLNTHHVILI